MSIDYRVFPDKSVLIEGCSDVRNTSASLLRYLEENQVGIITRRIRDSVRGILCNPKKIPTKYAIKNFDDILNSLKMEEVNHFEHQRNYFDIVNFFRNLQGSILKEINPQNSISPFSVSPRFQSIVRDVCFAQEPNQVSMKRVWDIPEYEDMRVLADGICLKKKYGHLLIPSEDHHFIDSVISRAIKEKYGIDCYPSEEVLSIIKK